MAEVELQHLHFIQSILDLQQRSVLRLLLVQLKIHLKHLLQITIILLI